MTYLKCDTVSDLYGIMWHDDMCDTVTCIEYDTVNDIYSIMWNSKIYLECDTVNDLYDIRWHNDMYGIWHGGMYGTWHCEWHMEHCDTITYGVATVSRIDKIIGLVGRISSLL